MISDKHKDTTFSSPLNHYQYACRWNASLSSEPSEKQKGFVGHSRHQKGICQLFNRNAFRCAQVVSALRYSLNQFRFSGAHDLRFS